MNDINVLEVLGKNLHDIRFEKNISLQELSDMVDIDIERLMKFEAGVSAELDITQYLKLANALGVSYEVFTKGIRLEND